MAVWKERASAIWASMVYMGSRAVMGSWKIMEISLPRSFRSPAGEREVISTSCPSLQAKRMELPFPTLRGKESSPMMEEQVMLLPQPLSPTTPKLRFLPMERSTPSTSFTGGVRLPR